MAALFSLGTAPEEEEDPNNSNNNHREEDSNNPNTPALNAIAPNGLYLFGNEEIYGGGGAPAANKALEIWQQYRHHNHRPAQQQQRNQDHHQLSHGVSLSYLAGGVGGGSALGMDLRGATAFNVFDEPVRSGSGGAAGGGGGAIMSKVAGGGGINCQDCGNQAKKDCAHLRCRTCCRSRGFPCSTHVKSTWVPAAKRRERQQQQQQQQQLRSDGENNPKRPKENHGVSSSLACTRIPTISGLEAGQFPAEVNSTAVFRCVRLNSIDTEADQYAYQTAVNIGGHLFKGILYDDGPERGGGGGGGGHVAAGETSPGGRGEAPPQFNLGTDADPSASNTDIVDPSLFPPPFNAFMAGTQFFPPPRS